MFHKAGQDNIYIPALSGFASQYVSDSILSYGMSLCYLQLHEECCSSHEVNLLDCCIFLIFFFALFFICCALGLGLEKLWSLAIVVGSLERQLRL
jgi:hypothetical protein